MNLLNLDNSNSLFSAKILPNGEKITNGYLSIDVRSKNKNKFIFNHKYLKRINAFCNSEAYALVIWCVYQDVKVPLPNF